MPLLFLLFAGLVFAISSCGDDNPIDPAEFETWYYRDTIAGRGQYSHVDQR